MATTTSTVPRWKSLIAQTIARDIKEEKSVLYFVLTNVDLGPPVRPQARYVVHRGFVNEQRSRTSPSGVEPAQPGFGSNTCFLTTTDIRSPKAQAMLAQTEKDGKAYVDVAWWMEKAQLQFRLACTAHLIPHESHPARSKFDGSAFVPTLDPSSANGASKSFDWGHERQRIFEKMSPPLLASFEHPPPGSKHPKESEIDVEGAGKDHPESQNDKENPWPAELPPPAKARTQEEKDLLAISDTNFALVVLAPYRVDVLDLARNKRSIFDLKSERKPGQQEEWTERRVVP